MNDLLTIQNKIYEIRGQRVMLDRDLAALYGVETAQLKRAVKRNFKRFEGEDFMMEVSQEEILRCQFGTSSWGGSRYNALVLHWLNCNPKKLKRKNESLLDLSSLKMINNR